MISRIGYLIMDFLRFLWFIIVFDVVSFDVLLVFYWRNLEIFLRLVENICFLMWFSLFVNREVFLFVVFWDEFMIFWNFLIKV